VIPEKVLSALADGEQSVDELAVNTGLPVHKVNFALGRLLIDRRVQRQEDSGVYLWRLA
jgi:predicted Rossmann fold nucleotide-binding protein DprA/Smf involved in DNA uptake